MPDTDKDGLSDAKERALGTDPNDKDSDNDGLSDYAEIRLGTNPKNHNTDGDFYGDGAEVGSHHDPGLHDPDPRYGYRERRFRATADDPDADGLPTMVEEVLGTDPADPDTDNDGLGDFVEDRRRTDPLSKFSDGKGDTTTDLQDVEREIAKPHKAGDRLGAADADTGAGEVVTAAVTGAVGGAGRAAPTGAALHDGFPGDDGRSDDEPSSTEDTVPSTTTDRTSAVAAQAAEQRTAFLDAARAQIGDTYKFGAETDLSDPDPTAFDSSELVQWAASQAGVEVPDGSWKQYQFLHEKGSTMSVEDALQTPGALVFGFSSDPLAANDRPARAYVAISLGNGKVLDVSERAGEVREMEPGNFFTHAGYIPGMAEDIDSDGDGMIDIDERVMGLNPHDPTDFGPAPTPPTPGEELPDTDGDGMVDVDEEVMGLDPNDPTDFPPKATPPTPGEELPDTDGDGMVDVDEEVMGLDPNDPTDFPPKATSPTTGEDAGSGSGPETESEYETEEYEPDAAYTPSEDGFGADDLGGGYDPGGYDTATSAYADTEDDADADTYEDAASFDA